MNKEQRDQFEDEHRRLTVEVSRIRQELKKQGDILHEVARQLRDNPSLLQFSNSPFNQGQLALLARASTCDWNTFPDKKDIAALLQTLRERELELGSVQMKLKSG